MSPSRVRTGGVWIITSFFLAGSVLAQEYRGTILGRIQDTSAGSLAGAAVTIINEKTDGISKTISERDGAYQVPFLIPGTYRVEIEMPGFNKFTRAGITVAVNQKVTVNITMQVGDVKETVVITADAPLLDTTTGGLGQVINRRQVESMPLNGRMIFMLNNLATGVIWQVPTFGATGTSGLRPFDNAGGSAWSLNGGRPGTNEFLLDGAPDSTNGQFNFSPPVDAVQEFKIQTNTYDAQYGRTGGGVVNMALKSGTNEFHGQAWDFVRNGSWDANNTLNKSQTPPAPRPSHTFNQWGTTITGPVIKEKTFFMFTYEGLHELVPFPFTTSVPTAAERLGDFSQSYIDQTTPLIIYDPLTTRPDPNRPGRFIRDPFPGNKIPANRINPIAFKILNQIYPLPNVTNQRLNDFVNTTNLGHYDYDAELGRIDHQFSPSSKMFASFWHNHRDELRSNNGLQGTPANQGNWPQTRINYGAIIDFVHALNAETLLNVRAGYTRFEEDASQDEPKAFDRSTLGFTNLPGQYLPRVDLNQYTGIGVGSQSSSPANTVSLQSNLTRVFSHHTLKVGGEYRNIRTNNSSTGDSNGIFTFTRDFTRADPNTADNASGNAVASMLLGYPNSASVGAGNSRATQWHYIAGFLQDDFRVNRKLTLNLGLRWDFESPVTDRYNRIVRGFDYGAPSPVAAQVKNAPGAANCPACANLTGGLLYAGVNGVPRGLFEPEYGNFQPRAGFAFALNDKTVVRGGYGLYYSPTGAQGPQDGFFVSTPYFAYDVTGKVGTPELGLNTFQNPFPGGLARAPGAADGLSTLLGRGVSFDDPTRKIPSIQQWNIGFQREIGRNLIVDIAYVGSHQRNLQSYHGGGSSSETGVLINEISADDLAKGAVYLQQTVANPFAGLLPGTSRNSATIQRQELLRPYPQFGGITKNQNNVGTGDFKALQVRIEKRLSHGLSFLSSYELSRSTEDIDFLDPRDTKPSHSLTGYDRTHHWVLSGIWELPFGQGRKFGGSSKGLAQALIGGWTTVWTLTMESGVPLGQPDLIQLASAKLDHPTADRWFNTCGIDSNGLLQHCLPGETPVWQQRQPFTRRVTPIRFDDVRAPWKPYLVDASLLKRFSVKKTRFEYRFETFNTFNSVILNTPSTDFNSVNFGKITSKDTIYFPRNIQMSLKVYF